MKHLCHSLSNCLLYLSFQMMGAIQGIEDLEEMKRKKIQKT